MGEEKEPKLKAVEQDAGDRIIPGTKFYINLCQGNLDGSIDTHPDGKFLSLDEAKIGAVDLMDEYHLQTWVYECRPVLKVLRGKLRVLKIPPR